LLDAGADVNGIRIVAFPTTQAGVPERSIHLTLLYCVVVGGHLETARLILDRGAELQGSSTGGQGGLDLPRPTPFRTRATRIS
jgi:hypothetical protein